MCAVLKNQAFLSRIAGPSHIFKETLSCSWQVQVKPTSKIALTVRSARGHYTNHRVPTW